MNSNFKELLQCLNEAGANYLVIGGYAVMEYTEPRYTKDLDIWVGTDSANASMVYEALVAFGAPIEQITPADFCEPYIFYQIGVAPIRVDILTSVSGVDFDPAWDRREMRPILDIVVPFISRDDLISSKLAAGRRQVKADVAALRRAAKRM